MNLKNKKILLVDDEEDILEFLSYNLSKQGYRVFQANNGRKGLEIAKSEFPNLILLDVMMPEMDGMQVCEKLRELDQLDNTFIVFLTARSEEYSELAGFAVGADDYITKPIKPKLLLSRVQAILRRGRNDSFDNQISIEDLQIDKARFQLFHRSQEIHLAKKEFNLLYYLMTSPGKVFSRENIID